MVTVNNPNIPTTNIKQLAQKYDAFLIDIWGVVHEGINPYPGAIECLHALISLNKSILFLSNAPRPGSVTLHKLLEFGLNATEEMIITSGDVVREQLLEFKDPIFKDFGKCFYHLGANRNTDILAGITADITLKLEEANFILLTAYIDEGEDLNQYDDFLKKAALLNIPAICANPDKIVIHGNKIRYCAGILAEKYQKMGGTVYFYGKPYLSIYEAAFKRLKEKGIYHKNKILMIGDTLETDILGANTATIDSALVLSGNTELLLANTKQTLSDVIKKINVSPTWILEKFSID